MRVNWLAVRRAGGALGGVLLAREGCLVASAATLAGYTTEAVLIGSAGLLLGSALVYWAATA